MLDIDNFKQINDTWGHKEGDNVIKEISHILRRVADETGVSGVEAANFDMVDFEAMCAKEYELHGGSSLRPVPVIMDVKSPIGRWGGEEFMVLLQDSSLKTAIDFADRVRVAFNDVTFEKAGRRSVSVGVIELRKGESADAAFVRVDRALYRAKKNGKNCVVVSEGENDG
jgi:PleD family two-component response regulator